jgi:hypothetical protein
MYETHELAEPQEQASHDLTPSDQNRLPPKATLAPST